MLTNIKIKEVCRGLLRHKYHFDKKEIDEPMGSDGVFKDFNCSIDKTISLFDF